jgi:uncharacterized protein (DUF433 family)
MEKQLEEKNNESVVTVLNHADVIESIQKGESKAQVAKKFGIPLKRVELIVKFDAIKKKK